MFRQLKPGIVFAAALFLGAAYIAGIRDTPTFTSPLVDAFTYDQSARRIAHEGPGALETPYYQPPVYPMFLGALYRMTDGNYIAPRIANVAFTAATAALVYILASGIAGVIAGVAAALLFALYGPVLYFEGEILPVSLLLCMHTAAIAFALRADAQRRPFASLAIAGALLGIAVGARPTGLLLAGALAVWWARGPGTNEVARHRRSALAVAGLVGLVCVIPWTLSNLVRGGEPVLVSWNGGINFYLGNGADSESLSSIQPGIAWERLQLEPRRAGIASHSEESRYWVRRGLAEAANNPRAWGKALLRKFVRLFAARETPRNTDWEAFRTESPILALPLPGFGVVAPLAFWAFARGLIPKRTRTLILLALGCVAVQNLGFFVAERYRLEAVPLLCVLAGLSIEDIHAWLRRRARRPSVIELAAFALFTIFVAIDWLGEWRIDATREAINRGVALRRLDRIEDARQAFREAETSSPRDPDAHRWLGEIALEQGRPGDALLHFDQALAVAPDYVRVLLGKAQALERLGRSNEAEGAYATAMRIDPWSVDVHLNFGVWLAMSGRRDEARRLFEEGLRMAPRDDRFRRNLERLARGL